MKPRIFVGSSSENKDYVYTLQKQLEDEDKAEVKPWFQDFFEVNKGYLESLVNGLNDFDFGVFVFAPDDKLDLRSETFGAVRDNVVFEFGLFMGRLGRERTFFVAPKDQENFRLLSDLLGVETLKYDGQRDDLAAALGAACGDILKQVEKRGVRNDRLAPKDAEERERIRSICARVEGYWWERVPEDGLGFFQIQMDELHNSVRLVEGKFYHDTGEEDATWYSVTASITDENDRVGLVYLRKCRVGSREEWVHGYGDINFEGSGKLLSRGRGLFYGVDRSVPKDIRLRRVHDTNEISTMQSGTDADRQTLVDKVIRTWASS